jgi:hypothetical protein
VAFIWVNIAIDVKKIALGGALAWFMQITPIKILRQEYA